MVFGFTRHALGWVRESKGGLDHEVKVMLASTFLLCSQLSKLHLKDLLTTTWLVNLREGFDHAVKPFRLLFIQE